MPRFFWITEKKLCEPYFDDINGYIDYDDVLENYVKASIAKKRAFDMHKCTIQLARPKGSDAGRGLRGHPGAAAKLKYTKKILETVGDLLAAVNGAKVPPS